MEASSQARSSAPLANRASERRPDHDKEASRARGASLPYRPMSPVVIVCGHYGVGKTNFSLNLAFDAQARGLDVTLADMDVVNPFFRSSDYTKLLAGSGIRVIAPVFAGTNLDGPSLSGTIAVAIEQAQRVSASEAAIKNLLIIDAGGDDVGATALGCFAEGIASAPYEMLSVVNRSRNLTQTPDEAVRVLHEIEAKSHLRTTGIVNNTHLMEDTDRAVVERGISFAEAVCAAAGLPLVCTTVPADGSFEVVDRESFDTGPNEAQQSPYPVQVYVRTPWQQ